MNDETFPPAFQRARKKAQKLIEKPAELSEMLNSASAKAEEQKGRIKKFWSDLHLLLKLLRAYREGTYRQIPWKSLVTALAAILYFLNPLDIIPDFLGFLGFIDDATVIAFVMTVLSEDLAAFRAHLKHGTSAADESQAIPGGSATG